MMDKYLKFPDSATAYSELESAGYVLAEYKDHLQGNGWGTVMADPDLSGAWLANIYDCTELHADLVQYEIPKPATPSNVRAGDEL